jgi:hypothetical protein
MSNELFGAAEMRGGIILSGRVPMQLTPPKIAYETPDETRRPRPGMVSVIGWVMIALGILGIVEMIWKFAHDAWSINLGVVSIVLGCGLLRGSEDWRKWTLAYLWFNVVVCVIALPVVLFAPRLRATLTLAGHRADDLGRPLALVTLGVSLALCLAALRILTREPVRAWFRLRSAPFSWRTGTR